ncbi:MAG: hypothetical protein QG615_1764 [Nitrospirota bacterium]|nr:hypothetical protein [Nitrospirota bacterium]
MRVLQINRVAAVGSTYPQYPSLQHFRDMAEERVSVGATASCCECRHQIDFISEAERDRFMASSGWRVLDLITSICPVCSETLAAGGKPKITPRDAH